VPGTRIGGAGLGEARQLRREQGEASTADVVAVMTEARRRVKAEFGSSLEPEVQTLGAIDWPADWSEVS
jgi:UDP-N-acetylenolpyruvoylglucosamine reductase